MLNLAEKEELIARCVVLIRDHGALAGRNPVAATRTMSATFDTFQIKATMNEDPEKPYPIHMDLRVLHPVDTNGHLWQRAASQIFLADITEDGVKQRMWSTLEGAPRALAALRKLMVLEDLADI